MQSSSLASGAGCTWRYRISGFPEHYNPLRGWKLASSKSYRGERRNDQKIFDPWLVCRDLCAVGIDLFRNRARPQVNSTVPADGAAVVLWRPDLGHTERLRHRKSFAEDV